MASLSQIRPQTTAIAVGQALRGVGEWTVWTAEDGLVAPSSTVRSLPISGVSVSTNDLDTDWAFVGVAGTTRHGASLAALARLEGACVVVTDADGAPLASPAGLPVIVVDNPRRAAAVMAKNIHAADQEPLVIAGVTGTNGKTTTTYFLRAALSPTLGRMGLFGTLEVDVGTVSITAERTTHEAPVVHRALAATAKSGLRGAVVEVSSHALSLDRVYGVEFDLAIFTNLQHDHLDFYENSMDLYFEAKASLFEPGRAQQGVVAVDDPYGRRLARQALIPIQAVQVLTDDDPDLDEVPLWRVVDVHADPSLGGSRFTLLSPAGSKHGAACPVPGLVNVQDAALAIVGAQALGVPIEDAIEGVRAAPPVPGRMEWVPTAAHEATVLVDYAHTPEALERLLIDMRPLCEGSLIIVFGTDGDRDASKRVPLAEVAAKYADVLWVTDENPRWEPAESVRATLMEGVANVRPDLHNVTEVKTSRRDAIREAIYCANAGDTVLITGKGPETYQDIRGVKHSQSDTGVATEVLAAYGRLPVRGEDDAANAPTTEENHD